MKNVLVIPAAIEGVATRKDRTIRLTIGTQEMPPAKTAELFRMQNALIYLAIKEEDFGQEEIEELKQLEADITDDSRKTHSQRLRAVFYRMWQNDNEGFKEFSGFYLHKMERIIEHYKGKLP